MKLGEKDTIAAISTGLGEGGIGIVRISGTEAFKVADAVFFSPSDRKLSSCPSHTIHYGEIRHPRTGEALDEALVSVMRSPRTYTTEDVVEINCHGGRVSLKKVLDACVLAGARVAEPGEFTRRAFLNGRIDLAQAEAVMDIISSETEKAQQAALGQLGGGLSDRIEKLREQLVETLALIELSLDFSDEDVERPAREEITSRVEKVLSGVTELLDTSSSGMMMRSGASVVLCGRPNVGKSSLMNALLRHDRVIVSPVAGTTRDVVEEYIDLNGVKVRLSDTAGMMDTRDRLELEGIRRSTEKVELADLVILVVDGNEGITEKDKSVYNAVKHKKIVVAANKADLGSGLSERSSREDLGNSPLVMVSAINGTGLEELEREIGTKLFPETRFHSGETPVIMRARHKECLEASAGFLREALKACETSGKDELAAVDIGEAVRHLGLITGKTIEDDVIRRIFSEFCIGK